MTDQKKLLETPSGKLRARALGIPFLGRPGAVNAITDVPGVEVGYQTLTSGNGALRLGLGPVRTGVTAILPRGKNGVGKACAAGLCSFNGNGELTGAHWINEAGSFNTPIMVTNTHAVGPVHRGVIDWIVKHHPEAAGEWLLPVVGETWDGYLNDICGNHISPETAVRAIDAALGGAIEEGSVGGGTGMNCYGFKGGNGSASRLVSFGGRDYVVGVFLQCNFGSREELTIAGHRLGEKLLDDNPLASYYSPKIEGAGSCIGIVATDAPMLPGQLSAMARRIAMGLARTGTTSSHFSGEIFMAFSTANTGVFDSGFPKQPSHNSKLNNAAFVPWSYVDDFYAAVAHAAEEAVLNAMTANETMIGRDGNRSPHLPHEAVKALFGG